MAEERSPIVHHPFERNLHMLRTLLPLLAAAALSLGAGFAGPGLMAEEMAPAAAPAAEAAPAAAEATPAPAAEAAAPAPTLNSGDTAWLITATALVLLMTIPGLFLFYGGLVRAKNALSVLMQCFAITCMITILWLVYGYSMAFTEGNAFFGGLSKAFAAGITKESLSYAIPESVFFTFQMTFAIITPALIIGAFAERMKFSAMMIFMALWFTLCYVPICHMVWGGGLMADWGVMDFAGGTVVHINAGVAGLVAAIILGKRKGYPERAMKPHSMVFSVVGAALLWVGWFGFNAGSAVAADQHAGMAMLVTQVATGTAGFTWMVCEWIKHGKPSVLGVISGAVAGLVAITPACGVVGPVGALAIGVAAAIGCFIAVAYLKKAFGYDDSLDAFGVHGVGGLIGALLTGIFAAKGLGGFTEVGTGAEGVNSIGAQFFAQVKGAGVTIIWTAVMTTVILYVVKALVGLRVTPTEEEEGLDLSQHGEEAYAQST
jgi:ammonium transporter, Amt family